MSYNSGNHRSSSSWTRSGTNSHGSSDQTYSIPSITHSVNSKKSYAVDHFSSASLPNSSSITSKTFHGFVSRLYDSWGVIDNDIHFSFSVCTKGIPKLNDYVTVEASHSTNSTYKWKAIKVQHCSNGRDYSNLKPIASSRNEPDLKRNKASARSRERSRDRRHDESDRKRFKRDDRDEKIRDSEKDIHRDRDKHKEYEKSPVRRSRTPTKRIKYVRYSVKVPSEVLDLSKADITTLKKRYPTMYIPSDFFWSTFNWSETLPVTRPYTLDKPCSFYIMHKDCDSPTKNDAVYNPPDLDYTFSAKVMLMAVPSFDEIFKKNVCLAEDLHKEEDKAHTHVTRLIQFLIGSRGKGEPLAIGGPWSPSLDGENPQQNPAVLIRTAIRTCKALTGVDLSSCSRWYRFMEVYYHRCESAYKGKTIPARVETVVFFLPEVWNCVPTYLEWDNIQCQYQQLACHKSKPQSTDEDTTQVPSDDPTGDSDKEEDLVVIDKCEEKVEPTHYSQLNPQNMKVNDLRQELEARSLSIKGLKPQLIQRLELALRKEKDAEAESSSESNFLSTFIKDIVIKLDGELEVVDEVKAAEEVKEADKCDPVKPIPDEDVQTDKPEVVKTILDSRYVLPETPHMIVHPSRSAKSGKFECQLSSLASLLDHRPNENKEHSFELFLFAEMFNEMLQRDFGFAIYKALCAIPEKAKEDKEQKKNGKDSPERSAAVENGENDKKEDEAEQSDAKDEPTKGKPNSDTKPSAEESKKKDRVKLTTKDPFLLLSFGFFDRTHYGCIFDRDLETLILSLGLQLSRYQVKKLIAKVCNKDKLQYRKITDKPDNEDKPATSISSTDMILGNRKYLPVFVNEASTRNESVPLTGRESGIKEEECCATTGLINVGGSFVDIENITASLKKSETARLETEKQLLKYKKEIDTLKDSVKKLSDKGKKAHEDIRTYRDKLDVAYKEKTSLSNKSKSYYKALMNIKDTVSLVETKERVLTTTTTTTTTKKSNSDKNDEKTPTKSRPTTSNETEGSDERSETKEPPPSKPISTESSNEEESSETPSQNSSTEKETKIVKSDDNSSASQSEC